MKRVMKKYGLPEPEFCEERDSFKVIFRNSSAASGAQRATQSATQGAKQKSKENLQYKILEY